MNGTETAVTSDVGASAVPESSVPDDQLFTSVAPDEPAEPAEQPQGQEPEPEAEPQAQEPGKQEATAEKPPDTAGQEPEPLPGKVGQALEAAAKIAPDAARDLRNAFYRDKAFEQAIESPEVALQYREIAPTIEDLHAISEDAQVYGVINRQYEENPRELINTLAEDPGAFKRVLTELPNALRSIPDIQLRNDLFQTLAAPIGRNLFANIIDFVKQDGLGDDLVEALQEVQRRYLGGPQNGGGPQAQDDARYQRDPEYQRFKEWQRTQEEREAGRPDEVKMQVDREFAPAARGMVTKYMNEKLGDALPEDIRAEVSGKVFRSIMDRYINGHPHVREELERIARSGDQQALYDRLMARTKAAIAQFAEPEIKKWTSWQLKLSAGEKAKTAKAVPSKDVGAGAAGGTKLTPGPVDPSKVDWKRTTDEMAFAGNYVMKE